MVVILIRRVSNFFDKIDHLRLTETFSISVGLSLIHLDCNDTYSYNQQKAEKEVMYVVVEVQTFVYNSVLCV